MKSVLVTSRRKVDLILLDIGLPGKDGLQLAEKSSGPAQMSESFP